MAEDQSDITETEQSTEYSAYICVAKREIPEREADILQGACSAEEYARRVSQLPEKTIYFYELLEQAFRELEEGSALPSKSILICLNKEERKAVFKSLMEKVLDSISWWDKSESIGEGQLAKLIDIYVENELCLHSMNMQFYAKRPSEAITSAKDKFLLCHELLKKILETGAMGSAQFLYRYAMLWCEVKVNNACDFNGQGLYFIKNKMVDRCNELCADYPNFTNAKVLLGLCYEPLVNSANQALDSFKTALKDLESECFASAVYYWMGKRYEQYNSTRAQAEKCYAAANTKKMKFRNFFKLAIFARDRKDYTTAIELFERIWDKLSLKRGMRFADPLELEYLFKSCSQMCYSYYKAGDVAHAIIKGKETLRVYEEDIENSKYFEAFYGEEAAAYKELLRSRCDLNVVYRILAECYNRISRPDKAREYQGNIK